VLYIAKEKIARKKARQTMKMKPRQGKETKKIVLSDNKISVTPITEPRKRGRPRSTYLLNAEQATAPPETGRFEAIKICPSCGSHNLVSDSARSELVCNNCGLVIEENIATNEQEWRAFDAEQQGARARAGAPLQFAKPNKGLSTEIDLYRDIRGVRLPQKRQAQLYRMRKWHKKASIASSSERNYLIALPELNRVVSYLGLPANVRENAALLYRKCVQNNLIRGRPIETVVQAVIYAASRKAGMPRTLEEISKIAGVPKKEIGRAYRAICHELGLKIPLTDPISYVPRYATALKLSGEAQEKAVDLLKKAMKRGLVSGRSPTGVSAAAVYIGGALAGERRTQKEVADVAGVTEVTIRNRYRELKEQLNINVDL